jgi:hypothetical protein
VTCGWTTSGAIGPRPRSESGDHPRSSDDQRRKFLPGNDPVESRENVVMFSEECQISAPCSGVTSLDRMSRVHK